MIRPTILFGATVLLASAELPEDAPIPQPRPETAPAPAVQDDTRPFNAAKEKLRLPQPEPAGEKVEPEPYVPPPIVTENPEELKACLVALKTLGVSFEEKPRIDDGAGCGIDRPINVTALGQGITLEPGGEMRCKVALQLARWTHEVVTPMLKTARPDETLTALNQASAYVCRKRNGADTGKISEHAHGNAVDISGLTFKSGNTFAIQPRMQDGSLDGAFQRAISAAACLYFTTVLDPGSDKAHETHLHLDVIERNGGYRYCW